MKRKLVALLLVAGMVLGVFSLAAAQGRYGQQYGPPTPVEDGGG